MIMITSPYPGLLLILSSIAVAIAGEYGAMHFESAQHHLEERNLQRRRNPLLRADTSPLSHLTNPHTHYFLEFPPHDSPGGNNPLGASLIGAGGAVGTTGPRCSDGSPYSFIFRRGTDPHLRKVFVEFESASGEDSIPWKITPKTNVTLPPLGSCRGMSYGFITLGASLFGYDMSNTNTDLPIFMRRASNPDVGRRNTWYNRLAGGVGASMHDWSYVFVPDCTPQDSTMRSANVEAVKDWVMDKFADVGGLDALVAAHGGRSIGGCSDMRVSGESTAVNTLEFASGVAMGRVSDEGTIPKTLVFVEGSNLYSSESDAFRPVLGDDNVDDWFVPPMSTEDIGDLTSRQRSVESATKQALKAGVNVAWIASPSSESTGAETVFRSGMKASYEGFHLYIPPSKSVAGKACPRYTFQDKVPKSFEDFVDYLRKKMSWSGQTGNAVNALSASDEVSDENARLSFLAICLILLGVYMMSWILYSVLTLCNGRCVGAFRKTTSVAGRDAVGAADGEDGFESNPSANKPVEPIPTPHEVWLRALVNYPFLFLVIFTSIPVVLSYFAYVNNGYTISVNLDFDSYLDIDTKAERAARQFEELVDHQIDTLRNETRNCKALYRSSYNNRRGLEEGVRSLDEESNLYEKRNGRTMISFFYQNPEGGSVFTPEVLRSIHSFEDFVLNLPQFDTNIATGMLGVAFHSNEVLMKFPGSKLALAKMDKYFSKDNLASNVTMTSVLLNNKGGGNLDEIHDFLEGLHRQLWKADMTGQFPGLVFSWSNTHITDYEANNALEHDAKWSGAALIFIAMMIFVKVRNIIAVLAGVLGLVLSFTSALYWQYHFDFNELTAMHVAGIFVMLGIGADDIFLTIDSFEHSKLDFLKDSKGERLSEEHLSEPPIIKNRMILAYKTAGSMMLVSSLTTAICFFSNVSSAVISIRDFGSYMGCVVVLNFVHVMTILPSALLVDELWLKPLRRKFWAAICLRTKPSPLDEKCNVDGDDILDPQCPVSVSPDCCNIEGASGGSVGPTPVQTAVGLATHNFDEASGEDVTPETSSTSAEELQSLQNQHGGATFLNHIDDMTKLDRFFVTRYAPSVRRLRLCIIFISLVVSVILAVLASSNFSVYDGTIIVFKSKYNLGRVQRVVGEYYPDELVEMYTDENSDVIDEISSDAVGSVNVVQGRPEGEVSEGDSTMIGDIFSTLAPIASPNQKPTSQQAEPSDESPKTQTSSPTESPVTDAPSDSPVVPLPWYPQWTGDSRGCVNDGAQPAYMNNSPDSFLFDKNFAWDKASFCFATEMSSPTASPASLPSPSGQQLSRLPTPQLGQPSNPTPTVPAPSNGQPSNPTPTVPAPSNSAPSAQKPITGTQVSQPMPSNPGSQAQQQPSQATTVQNPQGGQSVVQNPPPGGQRPNPQPSPSLDSSPQNSPSLPQIILRGPTSSPTSLTTLSSAPTMGGLLCPEGITNEKFCLKNSNTEIFQKREYYSVSLVWGIPPVRENSMVWKIVDDFTGRTAIEKSRGSGVDPSDPRIQLTLLEIVQKARSNERLRIHPQLVWIEALRDFAKTAGIGFPVKKELFFGIIEVLKIQSSAFRKSVELEIATKGTGLAGDLLFTSVSFFSEVPIGEERYQRDAKELWTDFAATVNENVVAEDMPLLEVQSDAFLDSQRTDAIVQSTLNSYFVANGLYLVVMLVFTGNLLLTLMVTLALILIFMCLAGLTFAAYGIDFGPVESLGVSIFVGLSANYLLHIAHAYHRSTISDRSVKIQRAIYVTGSPILWSAISTMGGSAFLFACRTWLLTELGILIVSIIGLSLTFSLGFLLALLSWVGPIPIDSNLHSWDLVAVIRFCLRCIRKDGRGQEDSDSAC